MARIKTYWHAEERKNDFYFCLGCHRVHSPHFPNQTIPLRQYIDVFDGKRDSLLPTLPCGFCHKRIRFYRLINNAFQLDEITGQEVSKIRRLFRQIEARSEREELDCE